MFAALLGVVSTFISSTPALKSLKDRRQAEEAVINLLTIYLVLWDVLEEGRKLLELAGTNPLETLRSAPPNKVDELRKRFEHGIASQGDRLYWLAGQLREDALLKYVDRKTRDRLDKVIGTKFDRTRTLAGTVSALVMTTMFAGVETDEQAASLVQSMYENKNGRPLSTKAARAELDALENELDNLKGACDQIVDGKMLARLLKKAKIALNK